jgi:hypothetical protein
MIPAQSIHGRIDKVEVLHPTRNRPKLGALNGWKEMDQSKNHSPSLRNGVQSDTKKQISKTSTG